MRTETEIKSRIKACEERMHFIKQNISKLEAKKSETVKKHDIIQLKMLWGEIEIYERIFKSFLKEKEVLNWVLQ